MADDSGQVVEASPVRHETPAAVVGKLLFFSLLMVVIPISTYFISKAYIFEGMLSYASTTSAIYAAIPAVIAVNCVIASYVYVAWHSEPWSDKKD